MIEKVSTKDVASIIEEEGGGGEVEDDGGENKDEFSSFKAFGCFEDIDNDYLRKWSVGIAWTASTISLLLICWILVYNFLKFF